MVCPDRESGYCVDVSKDWLDVAFGDVAKELIRLPL
jgi:hypothetical protein